MQIQTLPARYRGLEASELNRRIRAAKERLGDELVILGHYYQRDEVIAWADHEGDSFELSRFGAAAKARFIVFCGVRFMAEAAAILARPGQRVFLPNPDAGCPLADMADIERVEMAWEALTNASVAEDFVPVVYMNSSAAIKAFCARHGGTVCTSSSAGKAFDWAARQEKRVFFLPDQNLGINTALAKGFRGEEIAVWDPAARDVSAQVAAAERARAIAWKGFCHVHTFFIEEHVAEARAAFPGCRIAVHPECFPEIVKLADANGSTSFLKRFVEESPAGQTIVIGTEISFVGRLAREHPEKKVVPLARSLCPNMFRTSLADLCWTLEEIGNVNEVTVPPTVTRDARQALDRMLAL